MADPAVLLSPTELHPPTFTASWQRTYGEPPLLHANEPQQEAFRATHAADAVVDLGEARWHKISQGPSLVAQPVQAPISELEELRYLPGCPFKQTA